MKQIDVELTIEPLPPAYFGPNGQLQLGIQRGKEVVSIQEIVSEVASLSVSFVVTAVYKPDNLLDWKGPYVQGRPNERFVYLNWGCQQKSGWNGIRRAKILLSFIPAEMVATAVAENHTLHGKLSGLAKDGGPVAASVKTVVWQLKTGK